MAQKAPRAVLGLRRVILSALLIVLAIYFILDRICLVIMMDRPFVFTRGIVASSIVTGAAAVWILLAAATGGVTP